MEKGGRFSFIDLVKATRIERSLITLSSITVVIAFTNFVSRDLFILMACLVIIYSAGGIINAKTDGDFKIAHANYIVAVLFIIALSLSLFNIIILFSTLFLILMSFVYSKFSRKVLFGDSFALAICHRVIPIISASIIAGLDMFTMIKISTVFFFSLFLMTPMKNMNGWKGDKEKGYKTFMTLYGADGKKLINLFLQVYFVFIFFSYFLFELGDRFLMILLLIFTLKILMDFYMNNSRELRAYIMCRMVMILFAFAFVFDKAISFDILVIGAVPPLLYGIYMIVKIKDYNGIL